jgi:hypothetical protein
VKSLRANHNIVKENIEENIKINKTRIIEENINIKVKLSTSNKFFNVSIEGSIEDFTKIIIPNINEEPRTDIATLFFFISDISSNSLVSIENALKLIKKIKTPNTADITISKSP